MNAGRLCTGTHPPHLTELAETLLHGLDAARRARPAQHVRAPLAPKPNCHDAVDAWVGLHPGTEALRGWLCLGVAGGTARFYAHSLVRDADGTLIDPTFTPADPGLPFVPHPRQAGGFFALLCVPEPPHEFVVFGIPDADMP